MPLLARHPLATTFAGVHNLEYDGNNLFFPDLPAAGVPGYFDLMGDYARVTVYETDADTSGERRSEMSFKHQLDPTGERWYTWEFRVPSVTWTSDVGFSIMQIHQTEDIGDPEVAIQFLMLLENGQMIPRVPTNAASPSTASMRFGNGAFGYDRWFSMCLHANWQKDATGFYELYAGGVPILKRYGLVTAYDDVVGGWLKLGIYNYGQASGWGVRSIDIRNVCIWSNNDGYQTVMGGLPGVGIQRIGV